MQSKQKKRENALVLTQKALATREAELATLNSLPAETKQTEKVVAETTKVAGKVKNLKRMVVEVEAAIQTGKRY